MTVGNFSKEEATRARENVMIIYKALWGPHKEARRSELNQVMAFLEAARRVAPPEEK
jgi:hypothetical protein